MFPSRNIYFTEGSTFGTPGAIAIIGILRNWARTYNAWLTIIDDKGQPNAGPHACSPTCIVLNTATKTLLYRYDYYMYGQFMRFIQRDAVRINSTRFRSRRFGNVAFLNPDDTIALVIANADRDASTFTVTWRNKSFSAEVPGRATATFVWPTRDSGHPDGE
ncbi:MAG: glycoside hydrolase family 30 beta sandwich domain-containing protein [Pirellulaceae bacterium]